MNKPNYPTAKVFDLGCRLNQADGAAIAASLKAAGFELLSQRSEAKGDLVVVNSCAVTGLASTKSFAALRKLRRENPQAFIILSGCAASVEALPPPEGLPFNLLVPNSGKDSIASLAAAHFGLPANAGRPPELESLSLEAAKTRAHLKIQDGCDNFCAFCVVPFARGRERSLDPKLVFEAFSRLLDAGRKEIVLAGVNTCAYNAGGLDLAGLLEALLKRNGSFRIRLGSTEPHPVIERVIALVASERRLCRFLHIPLQHGSETLLKAMGRPSSPQRFAELVQMAAERIPGVHIGTDIIAGLPGETEKLFEESLHFIESLPVAHLHVFSYSPRAGTRAAAMPGRADSQTVKRRYEALSELSSAKMRAFTGSQLGRTLEVLTEKPKRAGFACGWSDNYLKLNFPLERPSRNELLQVEAIAVEASGKALQGRNCGTAREAYSNPNEF